MLGSSGIYWGAGRTRYSGARKGMGHQRALGPPRGVVGPLGASGVYWGLAGTLGTQRPEGV